MFKVKLSKFYILEINSDKQWLLAKLDGVKEEIWNCPDQISHVPSFFVTKHRKFKYHFNSLAINIAGI